MGESGNGVGKNGPKKTRNRVPASCVVCRRRKFKCDKQKPSCSSCKAHKVEHLCEYETQPWSREGYQKDKTIEMLLKEVLYYKEMMKNLEKKMASPGGISNEEHLPTYVTPDSSTRLSVDKSSVDLGEERMLDFGPRLHNFYIKNLMLVYSGPTSYLFLFYNFLANQNLYSSYMRSQMEKFRLKTASLETELISDRTGPSMDDCTSSEEVFSVLISELPKLPPLTIVNALIRRFFRLCYVFAPVIDEKTFLNEVSSIFKNKDQLSEIDITTRRSTVAILLIILRFSFLTVPLKRYHSNNLSGPDLELARSILMHNVSITPAYIDYAKSIIVNITDFGKINFRKIQAILLLNIYRMHSPEENDKTSASGILATIAVQMSRFHGLQKDPELVKCSPLQSSDTYLWRKTWRLLMYFDSQQALEFGMPLMISDNEVSTRNPFDNDVNGELLFFSEHPSFVKYMNLQDTFTLLTRRMTKLFNEGAKQVSLSEVKSLIRDHELVLFNESNSLNELRGSSGSQSQDYEVVYELFIKISLMNNIFILACLVVISCPDDEIKDEYTVLLLEIGLIILSISVTFADDPTVLVAPEYEVMIACPIWTKTKTVSSVLGGLLVESLEGKFSLVRAKQRFRYPDSAYSILINCMDSHSDVKSAVNIFQKLEVYYFQLIKLSVNYYLCFQLCYIFKIITEYIKTNFSDTLKNYESNPNITEHNRGDKALHQVNNFWNSAAGNTEVSFEEFLSYLSYNVDPFVNNLASGLPVDLTS